MAKSFTPYFTSPSHFIEERCGWFDVSVQQGDDGRYEVVLRIDGSYLHREDAEQMAEYFAEETNSLAQRVMAEAKRKRRA